MSGGHPGRRVLVTGSSGAGKTTLARRISERLGLTLVEVDALFHGPGWVPRESFVEEVEAATRPDGWVADSAGYAAVRDLLWERADTLVWLDYSRPRVMGRVLRRSFARATYDRELWNGNREGFRDWADPEHPVRWAWSHHAQRRAETVEQLAWPDAVHVSVVHLTTPAQARHWLAAVPRPRS